MIPDMWYAVLQTAEVERGAIVARTRLGDELVFWRDSNDAMVVMRDVCPHRQAKLSPGKLVDGNIQCHFHGFQYDRSGACRLVPANGRNGPKPRIFQCTTFPSREAHGFVWIWNGTPRAEYPPLPFVEGLDDHVYSSFSETWDTHYTRAIQGLLDVSHLPFVHAKTIGRGKLTLVNGPYTTLENNTIRVWISNQPDRGLPAIKPTAVPPPSRPADLRFHYPNVWQLWLGERLSQVIIAAPVDDETTVLYVRFYLRSSAPRPIARMLTSIGNMYNRRVVREDEEIIVSQRPKKADLDVCERFIPGDRPIALYLTHRRALILAAELGAGAGESSAHELAAEPEAYDEPAPVG